MQCDRMSYHAMRHHTCSIIDITQSVPQNSTPAQLTRSSSILLGNAVLFQNEPRVTTFSMHCRQNIFSIKQSSDIDVELQEGTEDAEYLAKLQSWSVQYLSQYTSNAILSSLAIPV